MQNSAMEASKLSSSDQNVRCHHCAGPLSKDMETSHWTVSPLIRDSFSMIGSAVGGVASAFYGFNLVMPIVQRRIKGPMWLHFLIGTTCDSILFSLCRTGGWGCSCCSTTCFLILSCSLLFSYLTSAIKG
uniref:Uncharacterized protein n=1 Tax=Glycine max TaxID=3847 RepID=I1M4D2_SOYBN